MNGSSGAVAIPVIWCVAGNENTPKILVSMSHRTVTVTLSPNGAD
jgi:hypothetical protein